MNNGDHRKRRAIKRLYTGISQLEKDLLETAFELSVSEDKETKQCQK